MVKDDGHQSPYHGAYGELNPRVLARALFVIYHIERNESHGEEEKLLVFLCFFRNKKRENKDKGEKLGMTRWHTQLSNRWLFSRSHQKTKPAYIFSRTWLLDTPFEEGVEKKIKSHTVYQEDAGNGLRRQKIEG
jgi:hypothetical protein